jgi:hypothetical protein
MMGHDVSRQFAGDMAKAAAAVKARVLVIVAREITEGPFGRDRSGG